MELLEYLSPPGGRAMPPDTHANDLWYWQIDMRALQPDTLAAQLERTHAGTVATRAAALHDTALGWVSTVVARDPDGHASLIAGERAAPGPAHDR